MIVLLDDLLDDTYMLGILASERWMEKKWVSNKKLMCELSAKKNVWCIYHTITLIIEGTWFKGPLSSAVLVSLGVESKAFSKDLWSVASV